MDAYPPGHLAQDGELRRLAAHHAAPPRARSRHAIGVGPYAPTRGRWAASDGRIRTVCNDKIPLMTKQASLGFRMLAAGWVLAAAGCAAPADSPKAADPPPPPPAAAPAPAVPVSPAPPAAEPARPAPEPVAAAPAPMSGKELQEALAALGYNPGRIDGKPGPKTREALKRFQKDAGLPATGVLDAETTQRLRAAPPKR